MDAPASRCPNLTALIALLLTVPPAVRSIGLLVAEADILVACLGPRTRQFVEMFCGVGALTVAARNSGLRTAWYDLLLDDGSMDMLTDHGFANAILLALSVSPRGTMWFGVPCSTFIWIARGHTRRSKTHPVGDTSRADVRDVNLLVQRVGLLLRLLALRQVFFVIEQPASSVLFYLPDLRALEGSGICIGRYRWQKRFLWLGHFGHRLWKPTFLIGIFPGLKNRPELTTRRPPPRIVKDWHKWRNKSGKMRCAGNASLRRTGEYPESFCRLVAQLIAKVARTRS